MPIAKIRTCREAAQLMVSVRGEIDISVRHDLIAALAAAIHQAAGQVVVVDLSQTSFMDATGIHALLGAKSAAAAAGAGLRVTGVSGVVALVLETTGLMRTLTGQDTRTPRPTMG